MRCRSLDAGFLDAVRGLYAHIAQQLRGLYFKDGGPIIAAQVDNEYMASSAPWEMTTGISREWVPSGHDGAGYLERLRDIAIEEGIDPPMFTCTGWQSPVSGRHAAAVGWIRVPAVAVLRRRRCRGDDGASRHRRVPIPEAAWLQHKRRLRSPVRSGQPPVRLLRDGRRDVQFVRLPFRAAEALRRRDGQHQARLGVRFPRLLHVPWRNQPEGRGRIPQ